jgi:hypothetical protein
VWDLNAFYPAPYSLAYSDAMLGYAPFAIVGTGPEAAVLRYNLIFIGAHALVLFGGYVLARQLGLRPGAAAIVGIALGVAPWRLAQTGHLQVLSAGGMFLALAMLARGHGIRWLRGPDARPVPHRAGEVRPGPLLARSSLRCSLTPHRPGWALAGWLVAAWQLSIGFGIGIPFLYVLLGCVLAGIVAWAWRHRAELGSGAWGRALPSRRLLGASAGGGLIFGGIALLLAQPYLHVLEIYPQFRRGRAWVELFSPPASGLFTAPEESTVWGEAHAAAREGMLLAGEMSLLPGFALYILASAGLFYSVWPLRVRVGLGLGAAGFLALSLGTNGPAGGELGYLLLMRLPGFEGIRTPGRLIVWATLLLALLAAGAVGALGESARAAAARRDAERPVGPEVTALLGLRQPPRIWQALGRLAIVVPTLVVFLEGIGSVEHATVPPAPPTLSTVDAPYLVLPTHEVMDMNLMLYSTDRFADMVNGSGPAPTELKQVRDLVVSFPDQASVAHLRALGVRSVVVLKGRIGEGPLVDPENVPIDGLGLTRAVFPDAVVFTIEP